jgi:hypothetical protein
MNLIATFSLTARSLPGTEGPANDEKQHGLNSISVANLDKFPQPSGYSKYRKLRNQNYIQYCKEAEAVAVSIWSGSFNTDNGRALVSFQSL